MILRRVLIISKVLLLFSILINQPPSFADIKVIEKEVEEIVGRHQSQEQVEALALQRAKRLAIEEAGTYMSSLTILKDQQLAKDEITALASGIVQAKIIGIPSIQVEGGVVWYV